MTRFRTGQLCALGALAITTLCLSSLTLMALNLGGEAPTHEFTLLKIAAGYDRRAEALLRGPALLRKSARSEAVQLSREAISQYPYDTSAWLRLAYVDSLAHGGLTQEGLADLKMSYDLVAIDPFVGLWRVRFALENSQSLSLDARSAVRNEASALWNNWDNRQALHEMAGTIRNPSGRLSLALWLNRLEAGVAK